MRLPLVACITLAFCGAAFRGSGADPVVHMLVPGFTVRELPVRLPNLNNLRFAPDGRLTALGYDGRIWLLRDSDGDGLEDTAEPYWDKPTLSVPLGMAWSTGGLFVSSHGKVSLLRDTDGDGKADVEEIIARGWPATDVGSGGVDATAVTLDPEGNLYFGLLVSDYSNAYRLRKRKDLKPEERAWLEANGDQGGDPEQEVSLYDLHSRRGTIQRWSPKTGQLETIATGIRVPVALAFNRSGDLFNTDQEGETWMPNGNPLDELNLIVVGKNYGFPPRHATWLPDLVSEPPIVAFGPQHQSTCGLVFNEPHAAVPPEPGNANPETRRPAGPAQGRFGPEWWEGDAFIAGESRGKIWRVRLVKTPQGYVGRESLIARLSMLTIDLAISPRGELYVCCHSGLPDWGTGPQGEGRIFQISFSDAQTPQPVLAWASAPTEVRVAFDRPLDDAVTSSVVGRKIEFGEYVRAADRYEVLKPPYEVVKRQEAAPRGTLTVRGARLTDQGRTLALETGPHVIEATYALTLPGIKARGTPGAGATVDLDYLVSGSLPQQVLLAMLPPLPSGARDAIARGLPGLQKGATSVSNRTESASVPMQWGDFERGRDLFFGDSLKCSTCHRIRGEGAIIGPDLSNLVSRDPASVLRDIRDPGASINPDYVAYRVLLGDGRELSGFVREQDNASIRLLGADGTETRFRPTEVAEMHVSSVSLMPVGLIDALNEDQVRDLMTFLLNEPPRRTATEINRVLGAGNATNHQSSITHRKLNIVLVAAKQDHGPGQHDYPAWQKKWQSLLGHATNVAVTTAWEWPTPVQFQSADVLVFYYWNHDWNAGRFQQIDEFLARGGGVALFHSAVIGNDDAEALAARTGIASFASPRTKYRHTPLELKLTSPDEHPITAGLPRQIHFLDEPYWPLTGDLSRVRVLASTVVDGEARPMMWTFEKGRGRVFGCVPGHYTWTFDDPLFRLIAFRGVAWAAGEDVRRFQALATASQ